MNLPATPPEISTEHLLLRALQVNDADTVARLAADDAVRFCTRLAPPSPGERACEAWISGLLEVRTDWPRLTWAVTGSERGTLHGLFGLAFDPSRETAVLDGWIAVPFRGEGIATEACHALVQRVFGDFAVHRLEARHLMRQAAAGRLLENLGLLPEGVRRQAEKWAGRFEDIAHYGRLRSD